MVILADELLEGFFSTDLAASFQLEPSQGEYHVTHAKQDTIVGGLMNMVLTNENKTRFNRLADGIGSALGRHAEWRKPAIGKTDPVHATTDVQTRESLLNPAQMEAQRKRSSSVVSTTTVQTVASTKSTEIVPQAREKDMIKAAQEAVMHRPNFAIDAIGDSDPEDDPGGAEEEGIMDEVSGMKIVLYRADGLAFRSRLSLKRMMPTRRGWKGTQRNKRTVSPLVSLKTATDGISLFAELLTAEPLR
jgi:hypothetical protein